MMLNLRTSQRTNLRSTNTHTHTQREGDRDLRGSAKCLYPHNRREIYLWFIQDYKRIYNWFYQELTFLS